QRPARFAGGTRTGRPRAAGRPATSAAPGLSLRFVPRALSGHVRHPAPAPAHRADAGRGLAEPAGRGAPSLAGPRRPASQRRAVITRTGRATPATTAGPRRTQTALLEPPAGDRKSVV